MALQWPLILFTLFIALASGILFMQGLLAYKGKAKELQVTSLVVCLVSVVVGGIAAFFHLQHWERAFNGFGHITSGITQELIGVVVIFIAVVVYLLMVRRSEDGQVPKWVGVMAMAAGVLMVVLMAHSYNMEARLAWNTPLLEVFYLVNSAAMGSFATLALARRKEVDDSYELLEKWGFVSSVVSAVVLVVYAAALMAMAGSFAQHGFYFDPTLPDVPMVDVPGTMGSALAGPLAPAFWICCVLVGAVLPAVLAYLMRKDTADKRVLAYSAISLLAIVLGGVVWRGILYVAALTVFTIF